MRVFIFDLDETVIDSKHRTPNNPDGTLNLDGYIANHTRENVNKDSLLPLAGVMKTLKQNGCKVWILTARDMQQCDYDFLTDNNIVADKIMSRDKTRSQKHYRSSDGDYKAKWLKPLFNLRQFAKSHFIMFDDARPVITKMRSLGVTCLDAKKINARLAA